MAFEDLAKRVARHLPLRYPGQARGRRAWEAARVAHLASLAALALLLVVVVVVRLGQPGLSHLQEDVSRHHLALLPTPQHPLTTPQVWHALRQLVSSALLQQNVTHNGTLKGVVSLRQFRSGVDSTASFFPNCDFRQLERGDRPAPGGGVPWRYTAVGLTSWSGGRWCTYPPEGYNIYLGDMPVAPAASGPAPHREGRSSRKQPHKPGHTGHMHHQEKTTTATMTETGSVKQKARVRPSTVRVAREGRRSLHRLQRLAWIDGHTRAVLLTVAVVQPATATVATVTIIFEKFVGSRRTTEGDHEVWWASLAVEAVDLRHDVTKVVVLLVFLVVHILVMIHELDVSVVDIHVAYVTEALGGVVRSCVSRATLLNLAILALHVCLVLTTFRVDTASQWELDKLTVAFKIAFEPEGIQNDSVEYDIHYHERLGHWHLVAGGPSQPGFGHSTPHGVENTAGGKDFFGKEEARGMGNDSTDGFSFEEGFSAGENFFPENSTVANETLHGGAEGKVDVREGSNFFSSNETVELFPAEKRRPRPRSSWLPGYNNQVLRFTFGKIIYWKNVGIILVSVEVMLYLVKLAAFRDYGRRVRAVVKTLQAGALGVLLTLALLLALLTLAAYLLHVYDVGGGGHCRTFPSLLKASLSYSLSLGQESWPDGCPPPPRFLQVLSVALGMVAAVSAKVVFILAFSRVAGSRRPLPQPHPLHHRISDG